MIRFSFSILFLLILLQVYSQNPIPNPGFEIWNMHAWGEEPEFWDTPNEFTEPLSIITVLKDASATEGLLSAKLATKQQGNLTFPGILCSGTITSLSQPDCTGGFPIAVPPASFSGTYKYAPAGGDSCFAIAILTKWNIALNARDTVATAEFFSGDTVSFVPFTVPFNYKISELPDSASVFISTTVKLEDAPGGSFLQVDELSFDGNVHVGETGSLNANVFPNPASDFLHIRISGNPSLTSFEIFDMMGRKIFSEMISDSDHELNISHLTEGIFFYRCADSDGRIIKGGSFLVSR